ncbi:Zinc-containing alcohol dehydrogenase [Latilactobacillus fuchuensis]|uniref:Zinc-containing alcohol dehydrogenase n=2 Tax=Latilactobacillus fuchuensis TaxID=164393 RepID=A0A2N9DY48_9LACO|nr:Zinc-containing alcohol dehydrogenase [Latilactobacillus fuchuensis]
MTDTMQAVVINQYGDEHQLEMATLPIPTLGAHQVLVQVKATSINPIDWKLREGYLQKMFDWTFPIVLGWDLAGIITQVGVDVTDWQVGDEVFARPDTTNRGTYAEFAAVDDHLLAHKPANVSFAEAAAVPLAGETAWQALFEHGQLKAGQTVLVQAGSGGVGSYAIQLAKAAGAHVITTTSAKHFDLVRDLGADEIIDYRTEKITDKIHNIDLVIDTLGGQSQIDAWQVLNPQTGRQISIVGPAEQTPAIIADTTLTFKAIWLIPSGADLTAIADLMAAKKVKSVIDSTIPFSAAGLIQAHQLSATNHATGKIVITF